MDTNDLRLDFIEKIQWGYHIIEQLKLVKKIEGIDKLIRKIQKEVKFLQKVCSNGNEKKEHLQCTNLIHLNAIVKRLLSANSVINVLKPFKYKNSRLDIDIVCDGGSTWIKVIARNARAVTLISKGNAEYGQKSVFDQAVDYIKCAEKNPHMYKSPNIIFHFACGIEKPLANKLQNLLGIKIEGEKVDALENADDLHDKLKHVKLGIKSEEDMNFCQKVQINKNISLINNTILNLDVSTLLAYITNMTNGHANFTFVEPLLTAQAKSEQCKPVKPILDELFEKKELFVCQTAYNNFLNIVNLIGGPNEKKRAHELRSKIKVINDVHKGKIMNLNLTGKIKIESRLIFASGENLKTITVSANKRFVRAAKMQGIECMVFLHEPRSLSEMKELTSIKKELY